MKESGVANYWVQSPLMKKEISKKHKFSIKFSRQMYENLEQWHGQHQIFGQNSNIMDTKRSDTTQKSFGCYKQTTSSTEGNLISKGRMSIDADLDEGAIPNLNL